MNLGMTMEVVEAANVSVMTAHHPVESPLGGGLGTKDLRIAGVPDLILESSNSSSASSHDVAKAVKLADQRSVLKSSKESRSSASAPPSQLTDDPMSPSTVVPRGRNTAARSKKARPSSKPNEFLPLRMDQQLRSKSLGRLPRRKEKKATSADVGEEGLEVTTFPATSSNNVLDRANDAAENAWLDSAAKSSRSKSQPPKPRDSKVAADEIDGISEDDDECDLAKDKAAVEGGTAAIKSQGKVKVKVKGAQGTTPNIIKIVKKCSPTTQQTSGTAESSSKEVQPLEPVEGGEVFLSPVKTAKQSLNGSALSTSPVKSPTIRVNLKPPEFLPLRSNLNRIPSYKNPKSATAPTIDLESDDEESEHPTELQESTESHPSTAMNMAPEASALDTPASPVKSLQMNISDSGMSSPARSPSKSPKTRINLKTKSPVTPSTSKQCDIAIELSASSAVLPVNLDNEDSQLGLLASAPDGDAKSPNRSAPSGVSQDSEPVDSPISPRRLLRATKVGSPNDKKAIEWEKPDWAKAHHRSAESDAAEPESSSAESTEPSGATAVLEEIKEAPRAEQNQRPQTVRGLSFDEDTQPFGDTKKRGGKRSESALQPGEQEEQPSEETIAASAPSSPSKDIRPTTVRGLSFEMKPEEAAQLSCRRGGRRIGKDAPEELADANHSAPLTPTKKPPGTRSAKPHEDEPTSQCSVEVKTSKTQKSMAKNKKAAKPKTQPSKGPDAEAVEVASSQPETPQPPSMIPLQSEPAEEIKEAPRVRPEYSLRPGLVRGMSFDEDTPAMAETVKARGGRKPRAAVQPYDSEANDAGSKPGTASEGDHDLIPVAAAPSDPVAPSDEDWDDLKEAPRVGERPEFSLRPGLVRGMSFDEDTRPTEAVPAARPRAGRKPRPSQESGAKPNPVSFEAVVAPAVSEDSTSDGVLKPVPPKPLANSLAVSEKEPEWTKPKLKSASKGDPTEKEKQIAWSKPAWVVNRNMALQQQQPEPEEIDTELLE